MMKKISFALIAALGLTACNQPTSNTNQGTSGQTPTASHDALVNAEFKGDYPTKEAAEMLDDELYFQRATQVYLWALPAINIWAMKEGSDKTVGAGYNVLPVWKERLNAKTKVTTPNSDCLYAMGYVNLAKDGPIVVEVPPKNQGIFDDFYQRPVTGPKIGDHQFLGDFGFAGPDGGKGAKYLLVPWDYKGPSPSGSYIFRSRTNNVLVFFRGFFSDPKDLGPANALIAGTHIYPLGKEKTAEGMKFPDGSTTPAFMLFPHDGSYSICSSTSWMMRPSIPQTWIGAA